MVSPVNNDAGSTEEGQLYGCLRSSFIATVFSAYMKANKKSVVYNDLLLSQWKEVQHVSTVFIPTFMDDHWCCVVVSMSKHQMYTYDPLRKSRLNKGMRHLDSLVHFIRYANVRNGTKNAGWSLLGRNQSNDDDENEPSVNAYETGMWVMSFGLHYAKYKTDMGEDYIRTEMVIDYDGVTRDILGIFKWFFDQQDGKTKKRVAKKRSRESDSGLVLSSFKRSRSEIQRDPYHLREGYTLNEINSSNEQIGSVDSQTLTNSLAMDLMQESADRSIEDTSGSTEDNVRTEETKLSQIVETNDEDMVFNSVNVSGREKKKDDVSVTKDESDSEDNTRSDHEINAQSDPILEQGNQNNNISKEKDDFSVTKAKPEYEENTGLQELNDAQADAEPLEEDDEEIVVVGKRRYPISDMDSSEPPQSGANKQKYENLMNDYALAKSNLQRVFYQEFSYLVLDDDTNKAEMLAIFWRMHDFQAYVSKAIDDQILALLRTKAVRGSVAHVRYDKARDDFYYLFNKIKAFIQKHVAINVNIRAPHYAVIKYSDIFRVVNNDELKQPSTQTLIENPQKVSKSLTKQYEEIVSKLSAKDSYKKLVARSLKDKGLDDEVAVNTIQFPEVGFQNSHNNCWINSILQIFFRITYVHKIFTQNEIEDNSTLSYKLKQLYNLCHTLKTDDRSKLIPAGIESILDVRFM